LDNKVIESVEFMMSAATSWYDETSYKTCILLINTAVTVPTQL